MGITTLITIIIIMVRIGIIVMKKAPLSFSTPLKKNRQTETSLVSNESVLDAALFCFERVENVKGFWIRP